MSLLINPYRFATAVEVQPQTFDFSGGTMPAGAILTRTSEGWAFDDTGILQMYDIDEPRFDHDLAGTLLGLLVEPERTNLFPNTFPTGPANGEPDGWTHSSGTGTFTWANRASLKSAVSNEVELQFTNQSGGLDSNVNYYVYSTRFQFPVGEPFVFSEYMKDPNAGANGGYRHHIQYYDSAGGDGGSVSLDKALTAEFQRYETSGQLPSGAVELQVRPQLRDIPNGVTHTTVRLSPQFELGAFATSPIPTNGAERTRRADVLTLPLDDGTYDIVVTTPNGTYPDTITVSGGAGWVFAWPSAAVANGERHLVKVVATPEGPTAPTVDPATFSVSEDAPVGTNVGTVTFSGSPTPTLSISGGPFAIDAAGVITTTALLDPASTTPQYLLTVTATNDVGTDQATVTVNVTAAGTTAGTTVVVQGSGDITGTLSNSGQVIRAENPARGATVVTGKLTITGDNNVIYGLTWDSSVTGTCVEIRGNNNKLVGCHFLGHKTGLSWQGCVDIMSGAQGNIVEYNYLENIRHVGIRAEGPSAGSANIVRFNHLRDLVTSSEQDWYVGIQIGQSPENGVIDSGTQVIGNLLEHIGGLEAIGIKSTNCLVEDNYLYKCPSILILRQGNGSTIRNNILNDCAHPCIVINGDNHLVELNGVWGFGREWPGEPVIAFSVGAENTNTFWAASQHCTVQNNRVYSGSQAGCFGWRNYAPNKRAGDDPIDNQIIGGSATAAQNLYDWNNAHSAGLEIPTSSGIDIGGTSSTPDPKPASPTDSTPPPPPDRETVVTVPPSQAVAEANAAPTNPS